MFQRLLFSTQRSRLTVVNRWFSHLVDDMKEFVPETRKSELLEALQTGTVTKLEAGVSVYELTTNLPFKGLLMNTLFFRGFYPKLLSVVREREMVALIGSPGVAKSTFQFYYMACIMNPKLLDEHLEKSFQLLPKRRYILRQINDAFTLYDCKEGWEGRMNPNSVSGYFKLFDNETLYLHEPEQSLVGPKYGIAGDAHILSTVSPNEIRYKEFTKDYGEERYMPLWENAELLVVGKYMKDSLPENTFVQKEFTPEAISQRFDEYGGILRHVLPVDLDVLKEAARLNIAALISIDIEKLYTGSGIDVSQISHQIMKHIIDMETFKKLGMDWVSQSVKKELQARLDSVDFNKKRLMLFSANSSVGGRYTLYEDVIAKALVLGVKWKLVPSVVKAGNYKPAKEAPSILYEKRFSKESHESSIKFKDMQEGVLYRPYDSSYPCVDMMYREGNELWGIQVTTQNGGTKSMATFPTFIERVTPSKEKAEHLQVNLIFCPEPFPQPIPDVPEVNSAKSFYFLEVPSKADLGHEVKEGNKGSQLMPSVELKIREDKDKVSELLRLLSQEGLQAQDLPIIKRQVTNEYLKKYLDNVKVEYRNKDNKDTLISKVKYYVSSTQKK